MLTIGQTHALLRLHGRPSKALPKGLTRGVTPRGRGTDSCLTHSVTQLTLAHSQVLLPVERRRCRSISALISRSAAYNNTRKIAAK